MSDLTEMVLGIIAGLCLLLFGVWFFLYVPITELLASDFWIVSGDKKAFLGTISEFMGFLFKFTIGIMIILWFLFGCVGASIEAYKRKKQEEKTREETAEILRKLAEEEANKVEEEVGNENNSGWLW